MSVRYLSKLRDFTCSDWVMGLLAAWITNCAILPWINSNVDALFIKFEINNPERLSGVLFSHLFAIIAHSMARSSFQQCYQPRTALATLLCDWKGKKNLFQFITKAAFSHSPLADISFHHRTNPRECILFVDWSGKRGEEKWKESDEAERTILLFAEIHIRVALFGDVHSSLCRISFLSANSNDKSDEAIFIILSQLKYSWKISLLSSCCKLNLKKRNFSSTHNMCTKSFFFFLVLFSHFYELHIRLWCGRVYEMQWKSIGN